MATARMPWSPPRREHARWFFNASRNDAAALESLFDLQVRSDQLAETFEQIADALNPPIKVLVRYT